MNEAIKEQWIQTLRSGKYEQGRGQLRSGNDKFCNLGVLCDLVDPDGWGWHESLFSYINRAKSTALLGETLMNEVGLSQQECDHISAMNDNGTSFLETADYIEANL